jgi:hypothetical protein
MSGGKTGLGIHQTNIHLLFDPNSGNSVLHHNNWQRSKGERATQIVLWLWIKEAYGLANNDKKSSAIQHCPFVNAGFVEVNQDPDGLDCAQGRWIENQR